MGGVGERAGDVVVDGFEICQADFDGEAHEFGAAAACAGGGGVDLL